jgi:hypothetical protein
MEEIERLQKIIGQFESRRQNSNSDAEVTSTGLSKSVEIISDKVERETKKRHNKNHTLALRKMESVYKNIVRFGYWIGEKIKNATLEARSKGKLAPRRISRPKEHKMISIDLVIGAGVSEFEKNSEQLRCNLVHERNKDRGNLFQSNIYEAFPAKEIQREFSKPSKEATVFSFAFTVKEGVQRE